MPRQVVPPCRQAWPVALGLLLAGAGCARQTTASLTFERGALMVASGSPRSAIPVLSQVIASVPDGPEPHAMLAVAYALDLQPEQALREARQAQSRRRTADAPGWEGVAAGIVALQQRRPAEAVEPFRMVKEMNPADSAVGRSAGQWMTLALIQAGKLDAALESLKASCGTDRPAAERTTAFLWSVLIHGYRRQGPAASEALAGAAALLVGPTAPDAPEPADGDEPAKSEALSDQSDRSLHQAGLLALRQGRLAAARTAFSALRDRRSYAGDTLVMLALVTAAQGEPAATRGRIAWDQSRAILKEACEKGPFESRGLANHLFSVVCALEGQPQGVIDHILVGQRLAARDLTRLPEPSQAQAENVWLSEWFNPMTTGRRSLWFRPMTTGRRSR